MKKGIDYPVQRWDLCFWFIYARRKCILIKRKNGTHRTLISWKRYDRFRNAGYKLFFYQSFKRVRRELLGGGEQIIDLSYQ